MEWIDEAIVLSTRPHGETASIVMLLTEGHGLHAGLLPGGQGRKAQSLIQPGNHVKARWRARLLDHLGTYSLDLINSCAAAWLDDPGVLNIINSACAMAENCLPERQPMPGVYAGLFALLGLPEAELWAPSYVKWEVGLLKALGYGLDLTRCAVSGETEGLTHVSPRTGRAVNSENAEPYKEKLLPIPVFLLGGGGCEPDDVIQGLELTGHFLSRFVLFNQHNRSVGEMPVARQRLVEFYMRIGASK